MNENYTIDHIGILTTNAMQLIKFYTKFLGFKVMSSQRLDKEIGKQIFDINSSCCFYRLKNKNLIIEIFEPHKHILKRKKSVTGYQHFGLVVKNRDLFIKYARKKKIKIIRVLRNGHSVYFIKDPDENLIEIRQKV